MQPLTSTPSMSIIGCAMPLAQPLGERALGAVAVEIAGCRRRPRRSRALRSGMLCATMPQARWRFAGFALELHPQRGRGLLPQPAAPDPQRLRDVADATTASAPAGRARCSSTVSYNEAARSMDGGEQVDRGADAGEIARLGASVRRRALQAGAAAQGEAQRSVRRRRVERATRRRSRPTMSDGSAPSDAVFACALVARKRDAARSGDRVGRRRAPPAKPRRGRPVSGARARAQARRRECVRRRAAGRRGDGCAAGADAAPAAVESLTFDSDFTPFMRPGVDDDAAGARACASSSAIRAST